MKKITNWRKATVFDIESDGFLKECTKMHVLSNLMDDLHEIHSIKGDNIDGINQWLDYHIDNNIPVVAHNGICYDIPVLEKLLGRDLSELMVIDTLALSWVLNHSRARHGLASFHQDYGIEKPEIDDWEGMHYEEYENRCTKDVMINVALWEDFKERLEGMYKTVKYKVDEALVGGKRVSEDEEIYIDRYINNSTVDEYVDRYLTFLMYKQDTARLREKTMFQTDVDLVDSSLDALGVVIGKAKEDLESIMPDVPYYTVKQYPKRVKLKSGKPSKEKVNWDEWESNLGQYDEMGNEMSIEIDPVVEKVQVKDNDGNGVFDPDGKPVFDHIRRRRIKVLKKYLAPNANSPEQVKSFLFSKGWKPRTFKFIKDKEAMDAWASGGFRGKKPKQRMIPQVTIDGESGKELCPSVEELAEESPEIHKYATYGMLKHRLGLFKGYKRDLELNGGVWLAARVGGTTNTLRDKHKELVNLPSVDRPWGKELRGSLIAGEGKIALGSDLSSLEDRVKHHFMLAYDPEYVATMMAPDYDPHIQMALTASLISEEEFDEFKKGNKSDNAKAARKLGKSTNYASVYGAGAETIARGAGVEKSMGKVLYDAYWELNWSVKAIAEDQVTFVDKRGDMWLINPVNGFCYSLRAEKDIFSTLCQGTGSFFFDRWVGHILEKMYDRFRTKRLSACFHDEYVAVFKDTEANREIMSAITYDAIEEVNKEYMLRRDLGCDVQFGKTYADIH